MATYTINWAAFNEVLGQLTVLQQEIDELNLGFNSGNTSALQEWTSEAKDAFEVRKLEWSNAATAMQGQAKMVQVAAAECREEYQHAAQYGTALWSK